MKVGIKDKEKALLLKLLTAYFLFCFFLFAHLYLEGITIFSGAGKSKMQLGLSLP